MSPWRVQLARTRVSARRGGRLGAVGFAGRKRLSGRNVGSWQFRAS